MQEGEINMIALSLPGTKKPAAEISAAGRIFHRV
jgi:hypothetical protein